MTANATFAAEIHLLKQVTQHTQANQIQCSFDIAFVIGAKTKHGMSSHNVKVNRVGETKMSTEKNTQAALVNENTRSNFSAWLDAEIQRLKAELPRGFAMCEGDAPLEDKLNTLLEVREALSGEITELRDLVEKQKMILNAVVASEFEGISCNSVNGVNWFDARDSVE